LLRRKKGLADKAGKKEKAGKTGDKDKTCDKGQKRVNKKDNQLRRVN